MGAYAWNFELNAFAKLCPHCGTFYTGGPTQEVAERELSKHFSQDQRTTDGFYGRCKKCVSVNQRTYRYGNGRDPKEVLAEQNGNCAICERPITFERGVWEARTHAYVDHDHKTGRSRGILCPKCNSHLGFVENSEVLAKALAYLGKYKCE